MRPLRLHNTRHNTQSHQDIQPSFRLYNVLLDGLESSLLSLLVRRLGYAELSCQRLAPDASLSRRSTQQPISQTNTTDIPGLTSAQGSLSWQSNISAQAHQTYLSISESDTPMNDRSTSFQGDESVLSGYDVDEEVLFLPDFKKYSKQPKNINFQSNIEWGGGQGQQFASTERKKTKFNSAREKGRFFANAIPFVNQNGATIQAFPLNTQSDSDRNSSSFVQAQDLGKGNVSPSKQLPRGLGPLSPAEQVALLAEPPTGPLQTSLSLIPVAEGSFAEVLGIATSPPRHTTKSHSPTPRDSPNGHRSASGRRSNSGHSSGSACDSREFRRYRARRRNNRSRSTRDSCYNRDSSNARSAVRELRPVALRLPANHPLKVELAELRAMRAERMPKWHKLRQRFPEKFHDSFSNSALAYNREMQAAADKELKLQYFIDQLEAGEPVDAIGLRQEQLESVIGHNERAPGASSPRSTGTRQQTARRFGSSRPTRHPYPPKAVAPQERVNRIPEQQQTRSIVVHDIGSVADKRTRRCDEPTHVDEFSRGDDFINIDSLFEDLESEGIEVVDLTDKNDYNDDEQRILDDMAMEPLANSNRNAPTCGDDVQRPELGSYDRPWMISPSISSDEGET